MSDVEESDEWLDEESEFLDNLVEIEAWSI